jgi:hypothetical protein
MTDKGARIYRRAARRDLTLDEIWEDLDEINQGIEWDFENILSNGEADRPEQPTDRKQVRRVDE